MNKAKRIAFISTVHGHEWPGSEYLWAAAADRMLAEGDAVFARCSSDFRSAGAIRGLVESGMQTDHYQLTGSRWSRFTRRFKDGFGRLKAFQPNRVVVSAGSAFDVAYQPGLAKFLLETEIPFLLICHFNAETFWVDEPLRETMRRIYAKCAAAVFVSEDNRRITERQLAMEVPNSWVIRPPFPLVLDAQVKWPTADPGPWRMACVARLDTRWKGQDVLFEVLAGEVWRSRNWELNLYGEGIEKGYLQQLAEHYDISDRVHFRGFVTDRAEIWRVNHIQVFPTRGEGGPMVLTEGMMAGRIAVITECGNVSEYVTDGEDGFLAGFACPSVFGAAMERAWAARAQWEAMGRAAQERIRGLCGEPPHEALLRLIEQNRSGFKG
jgi:glycosyltransferase involved in cell wall biosynthesis